MKLSLYDLNVIVDTLLGSKSIADGGTIWKYSADGRGQVAEKILKEMASTELEIQLPEKT